jgi:hypothetical protein
MVCNYSNILLNVIILGYLHRCTRRMESILPCCLPCGKAGGLQILRCQGIAVGHYSFTLDAWTLKPSGFCNVGVNEAGHYNPLRY